ncbi:MAG: hypothetical protein IMZ69_06765 [Spirochaetes bacterium]|nr:hypothetical protein [Spirochaetota bacterium]
MMNVGFNLANLGLGQWIVIGLSAVLGAWFVAGIAINRRVGRTARDWIASSLDGYTCGEPSWVDLATAAVAMKATRPTLPLERLEAILALERRENLPLWLFQHVAGKRDSLILRATTKRKPSFEAHLIPTGEYAAIASLTQGREPPLRRSDERVGFAMFVGGDPDEQALRPFRTLVEHCKDSLVRVSLRTEKPYLLLHVRLAGFRGSSTAVVRAMNEVAERI